MKQNTQLTAVLVAAFVVVGAYMYFVESKKEAPTDTKEVEVWSLSDNQAKDISPLVIKADNQTVTYTRDGDDWKVSTAPGRTVDKTSFSSSFNYLKQLTATRKLEDKPSDLGKYGLKSPGVTLTWGDANTKYKIEIGDKTPTADSYYAHVIKDDGIYAIAAYKVEAWKGLVSKPPLVALPSPAPTPAKAATGATGAAAATHAAAPAPLTTPAEAKAPRPAAHVVPAATGAKH